MHTPSNFDWSDLQYLLAVARQGSTLGASRAMGVNQSTVQRRLCELEPCVGQPLIKRQPTGCRLTELGERLLPDARRVEEAVLIMQEQVNIARRDLTGVVRVTCPEPLVTRLSQSDIMKRFTAMYPGACAGRPGRHVAPSHGSTRVPRGCCTICSGCVASFNGEMKASSSWASATFRAAWWRHNSWWDVRPNLRCCKTPLIAH
jgi:molybdenum-dependent DNA-binding transcriptional regulator ModE